MPDFKDVTGKVWTLPERLLEPVGGPAPEPEPEPEPEPITGPLRVPEPDAHGRIVLDKPATYILDRDISQPQTGIYVANEAVELDLNGHTVLAGQDGSAGPDDWYNMRAVVHVGLANHPKPLNFKLRGSGRLVAGPGALNHGIAGNDAYGVSVDGVTIEVSGADSQPGRFRSDGPGFLYNSTLISRVTEWTNRHDTRTKMAFLCPGLTAEDNVIDGGVSGFMGGGVRRRNVFILDTPLTNGVACLLYGHQGCIFEDNVLLTRNGRGVLIDDAGRPAGYSTFARNVMLALELPNEEYNGNQLTANVLKTRGQSYGVEGVDFDSNDCLVICGGPWAGGAAILNRNETGLGSHFLNNELRCVYLRPYEAGTAGGKMDTGSCIGFSRCGRETVESADLYEFNRLKGNLHCVQFSQDLDAGARWTNRPKLQGNAMLRVPGADNLAEWLFAAEEKLAEIGKDSHPSVVARLAELRELFEAIGPKAPLFDDGYDVHSDCELWDHHTRATIDGSGDVSVFQTGDSVIEVVP